MERKRLIHIQNKKRDAMEKTKNCPYCGEKISSVAKKCKHCGEWLAGNIAIERNIMEVQREGDEVDYSFWGNLLSNVLVFAFVLGVAYFTKPSTMKHKRELRYEFREFVKENLQSYFEQQGVFVSYLGNTVLNQGSESDALVDAAINARFTQKIVDYKIFSLGKIKDKQSDKSITGTIGIFGIVIPLFNFVDFENNK